MATVRLILYDRVTEAEIARKPIEGPTFLDAAVRAAVIGLEAGALFNVHEGEGHPLRAYWTGHLRERTQMRLAEPAVRGILSAKFEREHWGLDACVHCGAPVESSGFMLAEGGKFCGACAGIAEALGIGARNRAFLYDDGKGHAVSWTGPVMGQIIHRQAPEGHGMRGAVRYRVRMLDGSLWWGTGPTAHGNYIRLRPMKGE